MLGTGRTPHLKAFKSRSKWHFLNRILSLKEVRVNMCIKRKDSSVSGSWETGRSLHPKDVVRSTSRSYIDLDFKIVIKSLYKNLLQLISYLKYSFKSPIHHLKSVPGPPASSHPLPRLKTLPRVSMGIAKSEFLMSIRVGEKGKGPLGHMNVMHSLAGC